jgi:hypothetical protein
VRESAPSALRILEGPRATRREKKGAKHTLSLLKPYPEDICRVAPTERPRLVVVIDTEEEFDWHTGFSRENTAVRTVRQIHLVQDLLDEFHVTPVYVVDYPVASQPDGYRPLQKIHCDNRCLIGAHLHPWVNPPFQEPITRRMSYPGNLPPELEAEKLRLLGDEIEQQFGNRPVIYKAGRYGIGPATAATLEEQGYEIDLSVCPCVDYSSEGGPDFSDHTAHPYWFGDRRRLLELPLTVGFTGLLQRQSSGLHRIASHPSLALLHPVGVLARLNLARRVWLSPESHSATDQIRLIRILHADGLRFFSLAFHSSSLEPGHTPFVRTQRDLDGLLDRCRQFLDFFFGEFGGCASTPLELMALLHESGRGGRTQVVHPPENPG